MLIYLSVCMCASRQINKPKVLRAEEQTVLSAYAFLLFQNVQADFVSLVSKDRMHGAGTEMHQAGYEEKCLYHESGQTLESASWVGS